jgi:very-short-patch-repair endonuclease
MERWKDLTRAAERAYGIVTYDQLSAGGLSRSQVLRWVRDGRLVDVGYGAYRLGGVPPSFEGEVLAAISAFPGETWAGCSTAGRLDDLPVWSPDGRIELVRPTGLSAERSVARVHRSTYLPAHHLTVVRGIPCTATPRTVFDLARTTGPNHLVRIIDRALDRRLCTMGSLYRVLYEMGGRGRPGTRRMRTVLDALGLDHVPPESELEVVGFALLDGLGFAWQVEMTDERGYIRRVDGLHRPARLVVELDGAQHRREPQLSLDRDGDRRLHRLGYDVERLSWSDVTRDGDATRQRIVARLVAAAAA